VHCGPRTIAMRDAGASCLSVELRHSDGQLLLTVSDGVGFNPAG
jgi:signal transduction histidine kinase